MFVSDDVITTWHMGPSIFDKQVVVVMAPFFLEQKAQLKIVPTVVHMEQSRLFTTLMLH